MRQNVLEYKKWFFKFLPIFFVGCFADLPKTLPSSEPTIISDWVDTRSGTGGFWWASGHLSPAAQVPNGRVRIGPDTATFGKITSSSGYAYNDLELLGFSHTRLSGTGAYEGGVFRVKPGAPATKKLFFSHSQEIAKPGYYQVTLKNMPLKVELAATKRGGVQKYTALESLELSLWIDLSSHIWSGGKVESPVYTMGSLSQFSLSSVHKDAFSSRIENGMPFWANVKLSQDAQEILEHDLNGKKFVEIKFGELSQGQSVELQMSLSNVDLAGAVSNFNSELNGNSFDSIKSSAISQWNNLLSKAQVSGSDFTQKKKFYENLYRSFLMPTVYTDVDGRLRDFNNALTSPGFDFYGDLSLWDTFRNQSPLIQFFYPSLQTLIARSLLFAETQTGRLPRWTLGASHSDSMLGFPSIMILSEFVQKNLNTLSAADILGAVDRTLDTAQSLEGRDCLVEFKTTGFCSSAHSESVSLTLEYSYAYSSAYGLAKKILAERTTLAPSLSAEYLQNISDQYLNYSKGALKLWSEKWQAFVPKKSSLEPISDISLTDTDYLKLRESSHHVREGSLRQWQWYPAILGADYFDVYGTQDAFVSVLNSFMQASPQKIGAVYPGSGYWAGNEPNMMAPYLYSLWGRPDLTADHVRYIMEQKYKTGVIALDGDDDAGTLSSFFVWSAMGFYPLAGSSLYVVGTPLFEELELSILDGAHTLRIVAPGVSSQKKYVQSFKINNVSQENPYFENSLIENGGVIEFEMSESPTSWGQRWQGQ